MDLQSKLAVLADAAKYDASCASSGSSKKHSLGARGMGSTEGMGICHSYAPDGRYADRVSVNIELPSEASLTRLAPEKSAGTIRRSMAHLREHIDEAKAERAAPQFAPGGQSTQLIVGADDATDRTIMEKSVVLYSSYKLRRVYYSAFSPIPDSSRLLPLKAAPLLREHRLYQSDWLLRFYGFDAKELFVRPDGMLDLQIDPKLAWALQHREWFPVDINRAPREALLRVPGLGVKAVKRIVAARRTRTIRLEDLQRLRAPLARVLPFVLAPGHVPRQLEAAGLERQLRRQPAQMSLLTADA
jgi:predicted DNA-binding helix-hairpin-helix protein